MQRLDNVKTHKTIGQGISTKLSNLNATTLKQRRELFISPESVKRGMWLLPCLYVYLIVYLFVTNNI